MRNSHGGDIYRNEVELDFSVNTNPYGMPESVRRALIEAVERCGAYPDIDCVALREALGAYDGLPAEYLLCGNGASELFGAIVHAVRPKKMLLPVPSFSGYERAAQMEETRVVPYFLREQDGFKLTERILEEVTEEMDLLMVASPNNPVGTTISYALLEKIVRKCKENRTILVVDECFQPFTGQPSFFTREVLEKNPHVAVVRAFTKTFAIPGVRLGYLAAADGRLREKIEKNLSEWNLSAFAQAAGIAAAGERSFVAESARKIAVEREILAAGLERLGIRVFASEADFLLLKTDCPLYEKLLAQKILIRDCRNYPGLGDGFYRVAVRTREENECLLMAVPKAMERERE